MNAHAPSCNQRYEPRAQCSCGADPTGALCREIDRLRAELALTKRMHMDAEGACAAAEAAIDRVRELCALACHSHDSAACDLLDDLNVALED